ITSRESAASSARRSFSCQSVGAHRPPLARVVAPGVIVMVTVALLPRPGPLASSSSRQRLRAPLEIGLEVAEAAAQRLDHEPRDARVLIGAQRALHGCAER